MSEARKDWADMSKEERNEASKNDHIAAMALVDAGQFPTGIPFTLGGKNYIARPKRVTPSGGVTYGLEAQATVAGSRNARFNKFSFTLLGKGPVHAPITYAKENFGLD